MKMKELAQLIGLELEDRFWVEGLNEVDPYGKPYRFKITEKGLIFTEDDIHWKKYNDQSLILALIHGTFQVKKLPWIPENGEVYFIPCLHNDKPFSKLVYETTHFDLWCANKGLACRTEEEAIKLHNIILNSVKNFKEFDTCLEVVL